MTALLEKKIWFEKLISTSQIFHRLEIKTHFQAEKEETVMTRTIYRVSFDARPIRVNTAAADGETSTKSVTFLHSDIWCTAEEAATNKQICFLLVFVWYFFHICSDKATFSEFLQQGVSEKPEDNWLMLSSPSFL